MTGIAWRFDIGGRTPGPGPASGRPPSLWKQKVKPSLGKPLPPSSGVRVPSRRRRPPRFRLRLRRGEPPPVSALALGERFGYVSRIAVWEGLRRLASRPKGGGRRPPAPGGPAVPNPNLRPV